MKVQLYGGPRDGETVGIPDEYFGTRIRVPGMHWQDVKLEPAFALDLVAYDYNIDNNRYEWNPNPE